MNYPFLSVPVVHYLIGQFFVGAPPTPDEVSDRVFLITNVSYLISKMIHVIAIKITQKSAFLSPKVFV